MASASIFCAKMPEVDLGAPAVVRQFEIVGDPLYVKRGLVASAIGRRSTCSKSAAKSRPAVEILVQPTADGIASAGPVKPCTSPALLSSPWFVSSSAIGMNPVM
jgi:hypothetical protein